MKAIIISCLALTASCAVSKAIPPQSPIVFIMNGDVLKANKNKINAKNPSLLPAYKKLLNDADKALKEGPFSVMEKKNDPPSGDKHDYMSLAPYFWPDPTKKDGLPYIRKDGQTNPEVKDYKDKEYMPHMCELVQTLTLAYYFSGNESYADHAALLLKTWFLNPATKMNPNLNYGQAIKGVNAGRGAGLIDVRHFVKVIDGIGFLKGARAWKETDQKGMQQWFSQFLTWMQTSEIGKDEMEAKNNHGTFYDALRLSIASFIDSTELAKRIVQNAMSRLDYQMDEEGKFPKEMERTIALHYNTFDLDAFFMIASMAEKLNIDFWHYRSPSGKSLQKGFNFLMPYLTKQKEWNGQQIKPFEFEEGYPILLSAAVKYDCRSCPDAVEKLAGSDAQTLRWKLLY
ncbi:MAG: alginate lyase family protein [Flaviaesturariibacter sp.]|nr:alginate lyase family protein [Flaviaesturariibacter sp.]